MTERRTVLPLVVWEATMDVIPTVKGGSFDAEIIRTMGQVFDKACSSLRDFGSAPAENRKPPDEANNGNAPARRGRGEAETVARVR